MANIVTEAEDWFEQYIEDHVPVEMKDNGMIRLKIDHSKRVSRMCGGLAEDLRWSNADIDAARVMGILHDIGRFTQYSRFKTFSDDRSENHGETGYELLMSSQLLNGFNERRRNGILAGIRYHNRREIPALIIDGALPFLKLMRDADKLDIYSIFDKAIRDNSFASRLQSAINIKINGSVNPLAIAAVMRDETVLNEHIKTGMDFLLMLLSWIFDLNYQPSRQRLFDSGTIDLVISRLPKGPAVNDAVEHVLATCDAHKSE